MAETLVQNLIEFIPKVRGQGFQQLNKGIMTSHKSLFSLRNMFGAFFGYDLYTSFRNLIPQITQTSQQLGAMKSRFNAVSTSATAGADELNWIGEQAKRLGLAFLKTADDYSIFYATVSKNMGQGTTRQVFEQWAEAFRVLHIDPERQSRVLYALREMSSKGKIYMQDLALQLGSAVPDAMNIAAKSMGYTGPKAVERFRAAIKSGSIDVKKFIPAFSEAINKQYVSADKLTYAMAQTDAQLQLIKTHWQFIQKNLLESGMQDDIIKFLKITNKLLAFLEKNSKGLYKTLKLLSTALLIIFGNKMLFSVLLFVLRVAKLTGNVGLLNAQLILMDLNLKRIGASKAGQFLISFFGTGAVAKLNWFILGCYAVIAAAGPIVKIMDKLGTFAEIFRIKMEIFLTDLELKHPWLFKIFGKDETIKKVNAHDKKNPDLRNRHMEISASTPTISFIPKNKSIFNPSYQLNPYALQRHNTTPTVLKVEKRDASVHIRGANLNNPKQTSKIVKKATENSYSKVFKEILRSIPGSKNKASKK